MKIFSTFIIFFVFKSTSFSQFPSDSSIRLRQVGPTRRIDTTFWRTENEAKSSFWGNSTYISSSINFTRNTDFDFSIGRTNGIATYSERGLGDYSISSWGFGYGLTNTTDGTKHSLKAFYEYSFFPFIIIGNFGLRGEYIFNITDKQNYLRPSIGLTFVYVDISYNYSFLLNGYKSDNLYKHGLLIRVKYFLNKKNWERNIFTRQNRS